jgi:hypothetical protein
MPTHCSSLVSAAVLAALLAGCGAPLDTAPPPAGGRSVAQEAELHGQTEAPAARWRRDAAVYTTVLQRFLPGISYGSHQFETIYVWARAHPRAGQPVGAEGPDARPIPGVVRRAVDRALHPEHELTWVQHARSVIVQRGCWHVRGDAVLVRLDVVPDSGDPVEAGVSEFTACLGASGLTYVVRRHGDRWRVHGTTGSQWIS